MNLIVDDITGRPITIGRYWEVWHKPWDNIPGDERSEDPILIQDPEAFLAYVRRVLIDADQQPPMELAVRTWINSAEQTPRAVVASTRPQLR